MKFYKYMPDVKSWFAKYFVFLIVSAGSIAMSVYGLKKAYSANQIASNYSSIFTQIMESKNDSTINRDSLSRVIIDQNLKQESYTQMLDRQSDWFILYVSILFIILSIFGFIVSQKTISDVKAKNSRHYKTQNKIHNDFIKEFSNLKYEVYNNISLLHEIFLADIMAGHGLERPIKDLNPKALVDWAKSLEYLKKSCDIKQTEFYNLKKLYSSLNTVNEIFKDIVSGNKERVIEHLKSENFKQYKSFSNSVAIISNTHNTQIKNLCIDIMARINELMKNEKIE